MALLCEPHLRVRAATAHDLSAMATIVYEAMPSDPQWNYRFPLRKRFPEDNYGCTRQMLKSMFEDDGFYINVVTFPSPCLHEDEEIPAAVAVWEVDTNPDKDYPTQPISQLPSKVTAISPPYLIFYTQLTLTLGQKRRNAVEMQTSNT